jgi:hypothetical protein
MLDQAASGRPFHDTWPCAECAAAGYQKEFPMTRSSPSRRVFMLQATVACTALAASTAQAQTKVEEADENATALGYKHDTTKVDAKKYPNHQAAQKCNNCQFWQGNAGDAWAGCAMFGRKQIAANGWCMAYKKIG